MSLSIKCPYISQDSYSDIEKLGIDFKKDIAPMLCTDDKGTNTNNLFLQLIGSIKLVFPDLKDDDIKKITDIISPLLISYVTNCHKSYCDPHVDVNIDLICEDIKNNKVSNFIDIKNKLLPLVKPFILKEKDGDIIVNLLDSIKDLDSICNFVSILGGTDEILKNMKDILKTDMYNTDIKKILDCMCTKPKPPPSPEPPNPEPPSPESIPKYNMSNIYILISILSISLFLLFILMLVLYSFTESGITYKKSFITFILLLLVAGITFIILFYVNPKCMYKYCITKSDDWKLNEGRYKGNSKILGLISIDIDINLNKDNTITYNVLNCDGKACPVNDLLTKCSERTSYIDINTKTDNGYRVLGKCIDDMKSLTNKDNSHIVKDVYVQVNGNDYNLLLNIHGCVGVCSDMLIKIPLSLVKEN